MVITAAITGFAAHLILGLSWQEGLLIGAIVGSTDAAAVFGLLRSAGLESDLVLVSDVSSADTSGGVCEVEASFLLVFDAADLSRGAVAEVKMPEMIPFGLHSEWLPFEGLSH